MIAVMGASNDCRAKALSVARYRLHCVGASGNSFKVALFLSCAGLDWEPVGVDFAALCDQRDG
jgi:hypothetical protein